MSSIRRFDHGSYLLITSLAPLSRISKTPLNEIRDELAEPCRRCLSRNGLLVNGRYFGSDEAEQRSTGRSQDYGLEVRNTRIPHSGAKAQENGEFQRPGCIGSLCLCGLLGSALLGDSAAGKCFVETNLCSPRRLAQLQVSIVGASVVANIIVLKA